MPRKRVQNTDPSIPNEPRYRLHKRSNQAVVTLSGRDVYCGEYGSPQSHDRYRAAVAQWIARGRKPAEPEQTPRSVNEVILAYLEHAETYYRDRTGQVNAKEVWNIKRALRPLRLLYGLEPAADFGCRKLEQVQAAFVADGLSRPVVNRYVARVRHVFKWATAKELVPPTVYHGLLAFEGLKRGRTDAPETEPVKPVPDGLVDAVRPHVSRQVWGLIELQRLTGCRPGEAVRCKAVDIDMSGPVWLWRCTEHKLQWRGTERIIAVGPLGQDAIRRFLRADLSAYLFDPREAETERRAAATAARVTPLSCGNRPGTNRKPKPRRQAHGRYTTESYGRAIARACEAAFPAPDGLSETELRQWRREHTWSPNQLRHTFASDVRRQYGLEEVGACLGHTKLETSQVYAERDRALAVEVARRIG
jgi:integrase